MMAFPLQAIAPRPFEEQPGAYRWWYFDALSHDEKTAFSAIFMVGSIFSPYYAERLRAGDAPLPREHVAMNFVLYQRGKAPVFSFSEYGSERLAMDERGVRIAASSFARQRDGRILVRVDDARVATGAPVRAELELTPVEAPLTAREVHLSGQEHQWHCLAPRAEVRGTIEGFGAFEGLGYHDTNFGSEPPARQLSSWSWGRVHDREGTRVFFDVRTRKGRRSHELFATGGRRETSVLPPRVMGPSLRDWLLPMPAGFECEVGVPLRAHRALERAPFYQRFTAAFPSPDARFGATGIGEHIDFERLDHPFVRRMVSLRLARPDRGERGVLP